MAFNNNKKRDVNNDASFVVAQQSFYDKASLPTNVPGYLSYVQGLDVLALNTGGSNWRTFQTRPLDYKNEVILEQGTIGGGYNASSVFNTITKLHYASDAPVRLLPTLAFATNYGTQHSTYMYGYYHQAAGASCKHDWVTFTVSTIPSRSTCIGASGISVQPGPKQQNTLGVINLGTAGCYLNFTNDTWAAGYALPVSEDTGNSAFGANYGYANGPGGSNVYKLNWGTMTWTATASGTGNFGAYGKSLNTKWDKWFQGSLNGSVNRYNNSSDTFTILDPAKFSAPTSFQEQETIMGQDWGYWTGYNGIQTYGTTIYKTEYSSETTAAVQRGSMTYNHSSGSACYGPIP